MKFIPLLSSAVFACPMFVEFFPDPTLVSDSEGEYLEIRLDDFSAESLYVAFEEKPPLAFAYPLRERFVLVHDSLFCPDLPNVSCGLLQGLSMPNSRESYWKLWALSCRDSVVLPKPKAGAVFQRIRETDEWALVQGTFGYADPEYELGLQDCGISAFKASQEESGWVLSGWLDGCDSAMLHVSTLDFFKGGGFREDSVVISGKFKLDIPGNAAWVRLHLPKDDAPSNDSLDTLLVSAGNSPLVISEIHHCPLEPEPEWLEVYNSSRYAIPLKRIRFLNRSTFIAGDSIRPYESILVTRDSLALRSSLGFDDVRIFQLNFGYLGNASGTLLLAFDSTVVDSVSWEKASSRCPAGFNPHTSLVENTPGFHGPSAQKVFDAPLRFSLSSRIVRKKGAPLRVKVESESAVSLKLLDSTRREVWAMEVPSSSNAWWDVPAGSKVAVGVGYISLSVGEYVSVVGFVVRP